MLKFSRDNSEGFTLIEIILFFAISGLLISGILISTNFAINQQRYFSAVDSLKALLESQISSSINVVNLDHEKTKCELVSGSINLIDSNDVKRGTSECEIIGKILKIENNGKRIISQDVLGATNEKIENDLDAIRKYKVLPLENINNETYSPEWDTSLRLPDGASNFKILMIKSAYSGSIYNFKINEGQNISDYLSGISNLNNLESITICVDSGGLVLNQITQAITVNNRGSGSNTLEKGVNTSCQ